MAPVRFFEIRLQEDSKFSTSFFLVYHVSNDRKGNEEKAILEKLAFESRGEGSYYQLLVPKGKLYRTSQEIKSDYRFKQSIPVILTEETRNTTFSPGALLSRVALTPFTVLADMVILPIAILNHL